MGMLPCNARMTDMAYIVRKENFEWPSVSAFVKDMTENGFLTAYRARDFARSHGGLVDYSMEYPLDQLREDPSRLKHGKIVEDSAK